MIDITTRLSPAKGVIGLQVLKADGTEVPEKSREFEQVFTDYGFKTLYSGASFVTTGGANYYGLFRVCRVGTGTVERTFTDVGLGSILPENAFADTLLDAICSLEVHGGKNYIKTVRKYAFALGSIVATISEVGIFNGISNNTVMMAGQLIKDIGGTPTTLSLLADEQLIVTYTFYVETLVVGTGTINRAALTQISSGSVNVNGLPYDYTINFGNAIYQGGTSGTTGYHHIAGFGPTAMQDPYRSAGTVSVTASTKTFTTVYFSNRVEISANLVIPPSSGTFSTPDIDVRDSSGRTAYVITFSPNLPKTNTQTLNLSFKHTIQWRA